MVPLVIPEKAELPAAAQLRVPEVFVKTPLDPREGTAAPSSVVALMVPDPE